MSSYLIYMILGIISVNTVWVQTVIADEKEHVDVLVFSGNIDFLTEISNRLAPDYKSSVVTSRRFETYINKYQPKVLLLFDDKVWRYKKFLQKNPDREIIPVISAFGSPIYEDFVDTMKSTILMSFQPPLRVLARMVSEEYGKEILRVGVLFHPSYSSFLAREVEALSGGHLVAVKIVEEGQKRWENAQLPKLQLLGNTTDVNEALNWLLKEDLDAFWILNDPELLKTNGPVLKKRLNSFHKPVIVGVKNLLDQGLGNISVVQEPEDIATQINLEIDRLRENQWRPVPSVLRQPILTRVYKNEEKWAIIMEQTSKR